MLFDRKRKLITLILCSFLVLNLSGKEPRKISINFNGYINYIIYDRIHDGAGGLGLGLDFLINTKTKFKPKLETNFILISVYDVAICTSDGYLIDSYHGGATIFLGIVYQPINRLSFSFLPGISYNNPRKYFSIKPEIEVYPEKKKRLIIKASLTNIFIHDQAGNQPEGIVSLGLGIRLY